MSSNKVLIIGISGVTCGGKTTTATRLHKLLPNSTLISQDEYFLDVNDPRHTWIEELNHINYDILTSLDMETMYKDIIKLIGNKELITENSVLNQKYNNVQNSKEKVDIIIIEGFCIFNYKPLVPLCCLKYYFTLDYNECYKRRLTRTYEPPDCPGYFEKSVWPEHLKQLEEVKKLNGIVYFNQYSKDPVEKILEDINTLL